MLALILEDTGKSDSLGVALSPPLIVGGLSLVERAVLAAQRAGVGRSVVAGSLGLRGSMGTRLRARGADVTFVDCGAAEPRPVRRCAGDQESRARRAARTRRAAQPFQDE